MDLETDVFKNERCDWADEVERELKNADIEEQFSQCSQDTWLYYSTSSSQFNIVDTLPPRLSRSNSGSKNSSRQRKGRPAKNRVADDKTLDAKSKRSVNNGVCQRAELREMVHERISLFRDVGSALRCNIEDHKSSLLDESRKKEPGKAPSQGRKKVVCSQVKDGAVLVVTRKLQPQPTASPNTSIKHSNKAKKPNTPATPHPSGNSRADSSMDWNSDKVSVHSVATSTGSGTDKKSKSGNPSRGNDRHSLTDTAYSQDRLSASNQDPKKFVIEEKQKHRRR